MSEPPSTGREIARIGLVLVLFGLAVWASHRHGVPDPVPDVALGWPLLLHVERALALLAAIGIAVLIGWRALRGDLPFRLGQIEYAVEKAAADADTVEATHEQRLRTVEALVGIRDPSAPSAERTET